jgi:peptidoglycan endopeptidase LytE
MTREEKYGKLVYFARKHLGKPYKYGAKPYEAPKIFDCSSFTLCLYKQIGISLPRTALDQAHQGRSIKPALKELKIGDLIFIKGKWGHYNPEFPNGIGHVAIYVGNGKVINARWLSEKEGGKVMEEDAKNFLERKDLIVVKRII